MSDDDLKRQLSEARIPVGERLPPIGEDVLVVATNTEWVDRALLPVAVFVAPGNVQCRSALATAKAPRST